jgi:hypothetical protein
VRRGWKACPTPLTRLPGTAPISVRPGRGGGAEAGDIAEGRASCAAITLAQIADANAFTKEVRRVEGLPEGPLAGMPAMARSGKSRVPSDVPKPVSGSAQEAGFGGGADAVSPIAGAFGRAGARSPSRAGSPAGRAAPPFPIDRRAAPPMEQDLPPHADGVPAGDDFNFETEPDFDDAVLAAFGRNEPPTDPARIEAQRSDTRGRSTTASPSTAATHSGWPRSCRPTTTRCASWRR